jgi:predicted dehydrogenase
VPDSLRIALVGCGQIADAHLQQLRRVPSARLVAVCDRYRDLARQAAARFDVPAVFDDVDAMLAATTPDIVHVTTPPQTHHAIVARCIDAGAHVYVEKPFTCDLREARELVARAESRGTRLCLGLDQLFDPAWQECRAIVARGELGEIVHVEVVQGYDLNGPFGSLVAGDSRHWVHDLPGGLLQNAAPHALARLVDFVPDEAPRIFAITPARSEHGGLAAELRATIVGTRTSGSILFSSAIRPLQRRARVLGTRGSIEVDLESRSVSPYLSPSLPGPLARVELPWRGTLRTARIFRTNLRRFCRSQLHYFDGMRSLFAAFHAAILDGAPMPVPHQHALRITALLDAILTDCRTRETATHTATHAVDLEQVSA